MKNIFITLILLLTNAQSQSLTFDKTLKEQTAPFSAKEVLVDFHFSNTSDKSRTITKFDTPCTCMYANIEGGSKTPKGTTFKPGEKGVFKGRFVIEGFKGSVDKAIVVWMDQDDPKNPSIKLTARVIVPERVTKKPEVLKWVKGGSAEEKTMKITVNGKQPLQLRNLTCSNPQFKCELVTIREGFEYLVKVKPSATNNAIIGVVRLTSDSQIHREKIVQSFLMVKNK